jgi:hypothetical protein
LDTLKKSFGEGKTPAELRKDAMLNVKSFKITHITSKTAKADTNAQFDLKVKPSVGDSFIINFPSTPQDERKLGETREYTLAVEKPLNIYDYVQAESPSQRAGALHMQVRDRNNDRDRNAWLPSHFVVTADLANGSTVTLLDRDWPATNLVSANEKDADGKAKPTWDLAAS